MLDTVLIGISSYLIWYPNIITTEHNLEPIQNSFLRFLFIKFKIERPAHSEHNGNLEFLTILVLKKKKIGTCV